MWKMRDMDSGMLGVGMSVEGGVERIEREENNNTNNTSAGDALLTQSSSERCGCKGPQTWYKPKQTRNLNKPES